MTRHYSIIQNKKAFLLVLALSSVSLLIGCTSQSKSTGQEEPASFATPNKAVAALLSALETKDKKMLRTIFGPDSEEIYSSGDVVSDERAFLTVTNLYREKHQLEEVGPSERILYLGSDEWPFPIPLREDDNGWYFDTEEGKEEIVNRRIGRNELSTVAAVQAYVAAQQEYFSTDWDKDGVHEYAQRLRSTPGKKDGLFWARKPKEAPSPLGPLAAQAAAEGYQNATTSAPRPLHGYLYQPLTTQGTNAPGGKRSFFSAPGQMTKGFSLVAYPTQWGVSGIMTFMVGPDGKLYQKNLGEETHQLVAKIKSFDPDESWEPVEMEQASN